MYGSVIIDEYIIMPNHIHAIVVINRAVGHGDPTLQDIIGRLKSFTTYEYNKINGTNGLLLWQRSFYEHIIRNEQDLHEIREYIHNNALKWNQDKYYID
jgi:putative transposase